MVTEQCTTWRAEALAWAGAARVSAEAFGEGATGMTDSAITDALWLTTAAGELARPFCVSKVAKKAREVNHR